MPTPDLYRVITGERVVPEYIEARELVRIYRVRVEACSCDKMPMHKGRCVGLTNAEAPCKYTFRVGFDNLLQDLCLCELDFDPKRFQ